MVLSSITLLDCLLRCILGHNIVEMLLHQIVPVALGLEVPFDIQYIEEWSKLGFVANFRRFLELILVDEFFRALNYVSG